MKILINTPLFLVLQGLVAVQIIAAWFDGWLYQGQLKKRGLEGYTISEHGGIWFDVTVMSYLVAYINGTYRLPYLTPRGIITGLGILVLFGILGSWYSQCAKNFGEVHTHDGRTTFAGWIHGLYAFIAAWTLVLFYLGPLSMHIERKDLVWVSLALTPFFALGAMKFHRPFRFDRFAKTQSILGPLIIWAVADMRLWFMNHQ